MTPNEITTLIATEDHKELDVPFKKIIYERVKYWRSTLIKQSLDRMRQQGRFFLQTIRMPMVEINDMNLIAPVPLAGYKSVTTAGVPLPLRITDNGLFAYVGGIDGQSPFGYADIGTLGFLQQGKYSGRDVRYEYAQPNIYTTDPSLPMVQISGVFNEPEQAMMWATGTYNPLLDWWDTDIPMSGDIEQRVVQSILSVDMGKGKPVKSEDYQIPMNNEQQ